MPISQAQNPAIRNVAAQIAASSSADADAVGKILSVFEPDAAILTQLRSGALPPDQLLPVMQNNLARSPTGRSDLAAILSDPTFTAKLDAVALNFLKAAAGLEALNAGAVFSTRPVGNVSVDNAQVTAVSKLRELIAAKKLDAYYESAIGLGDPALKDAALALFNALPAIAPGASAQDLVRAGLWTKAPAGIEAMQTSARYLPGRQVKVFTNVKSDLKAGREFMTYDPSGPRGITCRATLVGENGNNFLVKVEGKNDPIEVSKQEVFELNNGHSFSPRCNYNDPFTKAKIAEAAIKMSEDVAKLDFTKMKTEKKGGVLGALFGRGDKAEEMVEVQKRCFKHIHDVIRMKYSDGAASRDPGRVSANGSNSGRAAVKGHGVCTDQRQVMRDLAYPFGEILGFDLRSVTGGIHRHVNRASPMDQQLRSMSGGAHDWLEVTYRPSMIMTVCDRTWQQANMPLFEAYGPYGDRYPSSAAYDSRPLVMDSDDVNMSGNISVANYEQQFGDADRSGRQGHMTATGNNG